MRLLPALTLLAACTAGKPKPDTGAITEDCNGVDDDGDGVVDNGFPDADADGTADCIDDSCSVPEPAGDIVEISSSCTGEEVPVIDNSWDIQLKWGYTTTSGSGSYSLPVIGNLTDDNGDGEVDIDDIPEIVFTTIDGTLVALSGDNSGALWELSGYDYQDTPAIADVDQDGFPDVVCVNAADELVMLDGEGTEEWVTSALTTIGYSQPTVADVDGDGDIEVITETSLVEGVDGTLIASFPTMASIYVTTVVADLDQDGCAEIISGENVLDCEGNLLWSGPVGARGNFAAIVQADGDDDGEVLFAYSDFTTSNVVIYDPDGTEVISFNGAGNSTGPPCAADFDGDGETELALPSGTFIEVLDLDGTQLWEQGVLDSSGLAGCSAFDVNGDGQFEVIYGDETTVWLYDGATGETLWSTTDHASGTVFEYPVVADVDNDGSAEIVVVSNGGTSTYTGLEVYEHVDQLWPSAGLTWPTHDFSALNVEDDGYVPSAPGPYWLDPQVFRGRPSSSSIARADLYVEGTGVCIEDCKLGPAYIGYQVTNFGAVDVEAGVLLSLYAVAEDAEDNYLVETVVLDAIPAGTSLNTAIFEVAPSFFGELGYLIRIDDDGTGSGEVRECNESNNEFYSDGRLCELL